VLHTIFSGQSLNTGLALFLRYSTGRLRLMHAFFLVPINEATIATMGLA